MRLFGPGFITLSLRILSDIAPGWYAAAHRLSFGMFQLSESGGEGTHPESIRGFRQAPAATNSKCHPTQRTDFMVQRKILLQEHNRKPLIFDLFWIFLRAFHSRGRAEVSHWAERPY